MELITEKFKQWLIEDVKAMSTISSYINDVNKFNEYLKERDVDKDVPLNRFYFTTYVKYLKGQGCIMQDKIPSKCKLKFQHPSVI
ncbi:hypothetical protein [Kurthia huakuii]|uniref:hypothetical protein n=1 Tax=Kurthia huakuii TaxID=1421019 RepID=UPI000496354E|nr:hypothetical protein [Kurthia huakuii]MBM7701145.1 site-specific recombinase XerD [Kurthia huakuii]